MEEPVHPQFREGFWIGSFLGVVGIVVLFFLLDALNALK
jgi:hypothetical protein